MSAETYRFGEFTFDCGARMLRRNGEECRLSPKGQQLLRALIEARPSALSRSDLYDQLWPETYVCETNLATVINELRRVLGDDARAASYIRTVHGFGYAFCGEVETATTGRPLATLKCGAETHWLFAGENVIGRTHDCHIVLSDKTVSRRHAIITVEGDQIWLRDLDSTNGTYIEGEPVRSRRIHSGDRIGFGAVLASIEPRMPSSTTPIAKVPIFNLANA